MSETDGKNDQANESEVSTLEEETSDDLRSLEDSPDCGEWEGIFIHGDLCQERKKERSREVSRNDTISINID